MNSSSWAEFAQMPSSPASKTAYWSVTNGCSETSVEQPDNAIAAAVVSRIPVSFIYPPLKNSVVEGRGLQRRLRILAARGSLSTTEGLYPRRSFFHPSSETFSGA